MKTFQDFVVFCARVLLGAIFFYTAVQAIMHWQGQVDYMRQFGIDVVPSVLLGIGVAFELIGSVLIALGLFTRFGAILLLVYIGVVTPLFHPMWSDPSQTIPFFKNIAIFGGLLMVLADGPARWSFDAVRYRNRPVLPKHETPARPEPPDTRPM